MAVGDFRPFIRTLYIWNIPDQNRKKRIGLDGSDRVHYHLFYFHSSLCFLLLIADYRIFKRIIESTSVHNEEFERETYRVIRFTCCCHLFMV